MGVTRQLITRKTNKMFGYTLRNIWIAFHFLDKDMMRKINMMIIPKLELIWAPHKKSMYQNWKDYRIATKIVPDLEDITYKEKVNKMQVTALKENRENR